MWLFTTKAFIPKNWKYACSIHNLLQIYTTSWNTEVRFSLHWSTGSCVLLYLLLCLCSDILDSVSIETKAWFFLHRLGFLGAGPVQKHTGCRDRRHSIHRWGVSHDLNWQRLTSYFCWLYITKLMSQEFKRKKKQGNNSHTPTLSLTEPSSKSH